MVLKHLPFQFISGSGFNNEKRILIIYLYTIIISMQDNTFLYNTVRWKVHMSIQILKVPKSSR